MGHYQEPEEHPPHHHPGKGVDPTRAMEAREDPRQGRLRVAALRERDHRRQGPRIRPTRWRRRRAASGASSSKLYRTWRRARSRCARREGLHQPARFRARRTRPQGAASIVAQRWTLARSSCTQWAGRPVLCVPWRCRQRQPGPPTLSEACSAGGNSKPGAGPVQRPDTYALGPGIPFDGECIDLPISKLSK
jgi:hypothetical protein